jgi:hypothetical protein
MLSGHWNQFGLAPENATTLLISARMAAAVYGSMISSNSRGSIFNICA